MKTTQISFEISEGILDILNESREQFVRQVRLFTAYSYLKAASSPLVKRLNWPE